MLCFNGDHPEIIEKLRWWVDLDNGKTVYQFDEKNINSWKEELLPYLKDNHLKIIRMGLQFRSNKIKLQEENAEGYSFRYGVFGTTDTKCKQMYCLGVKRGNLILVRKFIVPELICMSTEELKLPEKYEGLYLNV
jgi:hypothetical protein